MTARTEVSRCARCGTPHHAQHRFCPECGLPRVGDDVLNTQIEQKRREAERQRAPGRVDWRRLLAMVAAASMGAFVLGTGLLLFNRELLDRVVEPPYVAETSPTQTRQPWQPEWVEIPAGRPVLGPPGAEEEVEVLASYFISRFEVPNRLWRQFLDAEEATLKERRLLDGANPGPRNGWECDPDGTNWRPKRDDADRPVRYVTPIAAALFCEWLTRRLEAEEPGYEIRLPTRAEWEYAARGPEGRIYPWGDAYARPSPEGTGSDQPTLPRNVQGMRPTEVDRVDDDRSPFGIEGMGTNVTELAISSEPLRSPPDRWERLLDLIENRLVLVSRCGASYGDSHEKAKVLARAWNTDRYIDPQIRFVDVGLRLVKVRVPSR